MGILHRDFASIGYNLVEVTLVRPQGVDPTFVNLFSCLVPNGNNIPHSHSIFSSLSDVSNRPTQESNCVTCVASSYVGEIVDDIVFDTIPLGTS